MEVAWFLVPVGLHRDRAAKRPANLKPGLAGHRPCGDVCRDLATDANSASAHSAMGGRAAVRRSEAASLSAQLKRQ